MIPSSLILASASPRRSDLLREMQIPFEVVTADVPELNGATAPQMSPAELARENARRKASAVAALRPGHWVLGADTVVALGTRVFGKPQSLDEAREFLRILSGHTHEVMTGCALISPDGREHLFHEVSQVSFRAFDDMVIERYLAAVHVLDKAGAYAVQENGEWIIERVEGSRTNVIGLPTERLAPVLRERGIKFS